MAITSPRTRFHRLWVLAAALLLCAIIAVVRYLAGPEWALSLFFLFPITLATWHVDGWAGVLVSFVSALAWLMIDLASPEHFSRPWVPLINETFRLGVFLAVTRILVRHKALLKTQEHLACTDALTGVTNRRAFLQSAEMELLKSRRYGDPLTLLFIDIDHFKQINDRYGHEAGDRLLQCVAHLMVDNVRVIDTAARLGGDEFALLLPKTGAVAAQSVAEKLRHHLSAAMAHNGWPVTFSIGAATFEAMPDGVGDMVRAADDLMYAAKHAGRDRIHSAVLR
jgi:diguanylate cyclase (GGDEF)-like protein